LGISLKEASIAVDGFGNIGSFLTKYLHEFGAKVVAVSDSRGCIYNPAGLHYEKLAKVKEETGSVTNYGPGQVLSHEEMFGLQVEVLVPASIPDVINEKNAAKIQAKLIVEAANIPATYENLKWLHQKGVFVVPDIIANAGGVISSYAEYMGRNPQRMFEMVEEKIVGNVSLVIKRAQEDRISPRDAALRIAQKRIREAMEKRKGSKYGKSSWMLAAR